MATFEFRKATKHKARLRLALIGPAGSGKTYSALAIAAHLAPGERIAVIDTEHGSASKYADTFDFDVLELDSFAPDTYVDALRAAEAAGYGVVIVDSLSHAWMGRDGALEQVDKISQRSDTKNSFAAWRHVTPRHNALVEAMLAARVHVIATMRTKMEYVIDRDERTGKSSPRKVGLAPVQRDGLEYEFDVVGDLDVANNFTVTKTRCSALADAHINRPGQQLAETLRAWLTDGTERPAVTPPAAPVEVASEQAGPVLRTIPGNGPADPMIDPLRAIAEAGAGDGPRLKRALAKLPPGELRERARAAYYARFADAPRNAEAMRVAKETK